MSKISDLKSKIHTLTEIQSILGAMKNLAVIELSKISKLVTAQSRIFDTVKEALTDFNNFYGVSEPEKSNGEILCLMIGSERGFCGSFNEQVIHAFDEAAIDINNTKVIVIGRKLALRASKDLNIDLQLEGPNSTDEIPFVINSLLGNLKSYTDKRWMFIHHTMSEKNSLVSFPLEERFDSTKSSFGSAPVLNARPKEIYPHLLEQYLFAVIYRALYSSFLIENRERLRHMQGVVSQIDKKLFQLSLKLNEQRQEEITEELEILMLSSLDEMKTWKMESGA